MKYNYDNISSYLRYGFLQTDSNTIQWITSEQIIHFKDTLNDIILSRFYFAAEEITKQSRETNKRIVLALSWWIDSLLIYKVFKSKWINFDSINIAYNWHYSEKQQVLNNIESSDNIKFIEKDLELDISNETIAVINMPHIVSHPTIIAYKDLIDWIPEHSILVTWDLGDEIFWATDKKIENFENLPEYLFNKDELDTLFNNKIKFVHHDLKVDKNPYNTEIFTFYYEVTHNMWQNVINWRDIDYIPFYKYFIDLSLDLRNNNLSTRWKEYLYNLWTYHFWLVKDNLVKSWIKYPVNEAINRNYIKYIKENVNILESNWFYMDFNYLEQLIQWGDIKKNKWRLFSLVLFIKYIDNNDIRFQ